jgi:4-carboxymuconolactone decarboxylase
MTRIAPVPRERMTAEQKKLADLIVSQGRRAEAGPFAALLHAPAVAERVAGFVDFFLSDTLVAHKLKELVILVIARDYTAQYEWFVHERRARAVGLDHAVIEALRVRKRPAFKDPNEALVHDMTAEILTQKRLSDAHYARAVAALGELAVVELITLIKFYIAIAVVLVSYEVEAPDGAPQPLAM